MAKILLIDDDPKLRLFLEDTLDRSGHQVRCLERAEDGVDILGTGEFDLVLVDENMPGIRGSEFLKVLRKKSIDIPAILMTGLARRKLSEDLKKLNVLVVGKPAAGYDEFWKELEPVLGEALQGEAEIVAAIERAVNIALKAGKTKLHSYLQMLLDRVLLIQVSTEVSGNPEDAARILGVPLAQLMEKKSTISFQTEALMVIANHRDLTVDGIAEKLGCSRHKLYRDPILKRALKLR